jgi:replicative DNA helicase
MPWKEIVPHHHGEFITVDSVEANNMAQVTEQDYERFLLGSIIYGNAKERMLDVVRIIPQGDCSSYFTNHDNCTTYQILCELSVSDKLPNDALLISNEIWSHVSDDLAHGTKKYVCTFRTETDVQRYIVALSVTSMPGMMMDAYLDYAERIRWNHMRAEYGLIGTAMASDAMHTPFSEMDDFVSKYETKVNNLSLEVRNSDGLRPVSDTTSYVRDELERMRSWQQIDVGLRTGMDAFDDILGGLNQGELCVLAASTGYGKSMLASSIALNVATSQDPRTVMMFSLEMMDDQISERAIANIARVNIKEFKGTYERVVNGFYRKAYKDGDIIEQAMRVRLEAQNARLQKAVEYYETLPIFTDVTPALNANEIKSMVLQKQRQIEHDRTLPPVGLIIVDYLQIMSPVDGRKSTNRTDEVGDMSRRLKRLAKETGIPILCLAQLNRQAQDGEQPSLSMLRESGSIEQDADKVVFLWGENKGKKPEDYTEVPPSQDTALAQQLACRRDQMRLKLTVAKNRQGRQGTCDMVGDYEFQYCCTQSDEHRLGNEPFDDFFRKYYLNTRSGRDLFWPIQRGTLPIPGYEAIRKLKNQEMIYVDDDYNVIRGVSMTPKGQQPFVAQHIEANNRANGGNAGTNGSVKMKFSSPSQTPAGKPSQGAQSGQQAPQPVIDDVKTSFDDDTPLDMSQLDDYGF